MMLSRGGSRRCHWWIWAACLGLCFIGSARAVKLTTVTTEQSVPLIYAEAVVGTTADLTCDLRSTVPGDYVLLVLWYKDGDTIPFYSVDARGKYMKDAQHWTDSTMLNGRAHLRATSDKVRLILEPVRNSDEGVYKCRVDFKKSPTRNSRTHLTVITPTSKPIITDGSGKEMSNVSGLHDERAPLTLICTVGQGRPVPRVTWYEDGRPVESKVEYLPTRQIRSTLVINELGRANHGVRYSCAASNSRILPPLVATVTVMMRLPLLSVKIERNENRGVSANKPQQVTCRAVGSSPPPRISWWKAGTRLQASHETTSSDGNTSYSTLTFVVGMDDGGQYLTCRAENLDLPSSVMEDTWKLDVQYVPVVRLDLGSKLQASLIKEGDDVYMECSIRAHPWITKVMWKHNGKLLHQNSSAGIIMSNQSLVLQRIDRQTAGLYTCLATNMEGQGESNALALPVKFRPQCQPSQQTVYGSSRNEISAVHCSVDAHPSSDVVFRWQFNSSLEAVDVPPANIKQTSPTTSVVSHRVQSERDYGTLLCWARNGIGEQREPCVFLIQSAGEPASPSNCTVANITANTLEVTCLEGYDGGLPQMFILQVLAVKSEKLVANLTSSTGPHFTVHSLEAATPYELNIWAQNAKGNSPSVVLMAETNVGRAVERRAGLVGPTTQAVMFQMTPVLGALIGIVTTLIIVAVVIVFIVRTRERGDDSGSTAGSQGTTSTKNTVGVPGDTVNNGENDDDKNPDVVPNKADSSTRNVGVSTITGPANLHCYPATGDPYLTGPTFPHLGYPAFDFPSQQGLTGISSMSYVDMPAVMQNDSAMAGHHTLNRQIPYFNYECTYTVDSVSKDVIVSPRHKTPGSTAMEEELSTVTTPLINSSAVKNPRESAV